MNFHAVFRLQPDCWVRAGRYGKTLHSRFLVNVKKHYRNKRPILNVWVFLRRECK